MLDYNPGMPEPSVDDLCTALIAWARDRTWDGPGESPIFRFERWIHEDPERGWAVLRQLVDRAPRDADVMAMAAWRVPQLLSRDFRGYRDKVIGLLGASSCLDALLGPEVLIEEDYAPREIDPKYLAHVWLRHCRDTDAARWPEGLDGEDPEVRLRIALEMIARGPLKGLGLEDLDGLLLDVFKMFRERVIEHIELAARRSAAVRIAIWGVRNLGRDGRVPPELWARFQAAAGDTNACNTPMPAGEIHRLTPLEEHVVEAQLAEKCTFWAPCLLSDLVDDDPERAWETVVSIVPAAESPADRAYCGAGALEDLIRKYPERFIERVEELAQRDPAFRETLAATWITLEDIPEPLARRYFVASGRGLSVLDAPAGWASDDGGGSC